MLSEREVQAAAADIWRAEQTREWTQPVSDRFPAAEVADAYRIALAVRDLKARDGHKVKGHKVGFTSRPMRELMGATEPDYGFLYDHWFVPEGSSYPYGRLNRPLVEMELAFVMGEGVSGPGVNAAEVIRATDFILPALEIVDTRFSKRGGNMLVDSISDAASCGFLVLGGNPVRLADVDVRRLGGALSVNGQVMESGSAAEVMANPVNSVVWLANKLSEFSIAMQPGDVILSGSFIKAIPFQPGDTLSAILDQLGEVTLAVE